MEDSCPIAVLIPLFLKVERLDTAMETIITYSTNKTFPMDTAVPQGSVTYGNVLAYAIDTNRLKNLTTILKYSSDDIIKQEWEDLLNILQDDEDMPRELYPVFRRLPELFDDFMRRYPQQKDLLAEVSLEAGADEDFLAKIKQAGVVFDGAKMDIAFARNTSMVALIFKLEPEWWKSREGVAYFTERYRDGSMYGYNHPQGLQTAYVVHNFYRDHSIPFMVPCSIIQDRIEKATNKKEVAEALILYSRQYGNGIDLALKTLQEGKTDAESLAKAAEQNGTDLNTFQHPPGLQIERVTTLISIVPKEESDLYNSLVEYGADPSIIRTKQRYTGASSYTGSGNIMFANKGATPVGALILDRIDP